MNVSISYPFFIYVLFHIFVYKATGANYLNTGDELVYSGQHKRVSQLLGRVGGMYLKKKEKEKRKEEKRNL